MIKRIPVQTESESSVKPIQYFRVIPSDQAIWRVPPGVTWKIASVFVPFIVAATGSYSVSRPQNGPRMDFFPFENVTQVTGVVGGNPYVASGAAVFGVADIQLIPGDYILVQGAALSGDATLAVYESPVGV